jgi:hypothetical protein
MLFSPFVSRKIFVDVWAGAVWCITSFRPHCSMVHHQTARWKFAQKFGPIFDTLRRHIE